ncbi:MAG: hypothetical protein NWE89_08530 [Candidatus Bathyarchaeota archaeon]|nr:hypothetical protein [Candidatus Bathyarchaeota archaeon]
MDGTTSVNYHVYSNILQVRVDVELFGAPFRNMIIRNEEGIPLGSTTSGNNITVDSIGSSELFFSYMTNSLTDKENEVWCINVTSPVETKIILPNGAAFFDLSDFPLDLGTVDGKQYIDFEAGEITVYYLIGLPIIKEEAVTSISKADDYILRKESEGYILTGAKDLLAQAHVLFETEQFLDAKNKADDAYEIAIGSVNYAISADKELNKAEEAVTLARSEGRLEGLEEAESFLDSAKERYSQGSYRKAETTALQAYTQSIRATQPEGASPLIPGIIILGTVSLGGLLYTQRKKLGYTLELPKIIPSKEAKIDLEAIFLEHQDLRMTEKKVLRFIVESGGTASSSEIRNNCEIPKATAWRLIKRLASINVVEEMKVGNKNIVRIIR